MLSLFCFCSWVSTSFILLYCKQVRENNNCKIWIYFRVTESSKDNCMDSKNLAICWWPTLLQYEFGDLGKFEAMRPHLEDIVQTMVDQYRFLFCGQEEVMMVWFKKEIRRAAACLSAALKTNVCNLSNYSLIIMDDLKEFSRY